MRVEWDTGATNSYRMGKEGKYDLRLARAPSPAPSALDTPHNQSEKGLLGYCHYILHESSN